MTHRTLLVLLAMLVVLPSGLVTSAQVVPGERAIAVRQDASGADTSCPTPDEFSDEGVTIGLEATFEPGEVVSFGLPLPPGSVSDMSTLQVSIAGEPIDATATVLLEEHDADGAAAGIRSALIQFDSSILEDECTEVEVDWQGSGVSVIDEPAPFAETSSASDEAIENTNYSIEDQDGEATLVATDPETRVFFTSREPSVLATFPPGYLASTRILGSQVAATDIGDDLAGLAFISDAVTPFGLSAMYRETYPINADLVIDPTDPEDGYEGWLYDRCATFLSFYVHSGDTRFLREGYRVCSYYADLIELTGENRGIFTGKPEPDPKYSHLRGVYAYFALTGDEAAREAGTAMADRVMADESFASPYRRGQIEDPSQLWTERLLAVSLESLIYGHMLTGDESYLEAAKEIVGTAYLHITGDEETLAALNPGATQFPPQNCFIHTAEQGAEGDAETPWCSGWMPALLIDSLLTYQDQTGDDQVDEIFIRLTRYLRDVGTAYFTNNDNNEDDTFLSPSVPSPADDEEDPRLLVPLYGAGLVDDGVRIQAGEFDDYLHCLDATAISAAGIRALTRTGGFDENPIGPFTSEGESFVALHQELAACAAWALDNDTRLHRDPATWTDPDELAEGLDDPATFVIENNIGNVSHNVSPSRKISWWFNPALLQFGLLQEAEVAIPELQSGFVQP